MTPPSPGPRVTPADVKNYGSEPLYDPSILRTFFFQFENDDWEKEILAFNNTDIEVPARDMLVVERHHPFETSRIGRVCGDDSCGNDKLKHLRFPPAST